MKFTNEQCGRFSFSWDMNADGLVTISDVFKLVDFFFRIPVKITLEIVAESPSIATFFEINCLTGEGWGGAIFSAFLWWVIFLAIKEINFSNLKNNVITWATNYPTVTNSIRAIPVAWGMLIAPSSSNEKSFFYQRIYGFWILLLIFTVFICFLLIGIFLIMLLIIFFKKL
jgi:hypothetical protein